ncbi:MAG: hypothetical protein Q8M65_00605, partial [Rhodoglobus sp.]|nr:hypothetical protein [Rhodoglobus sp.]
MTHAPHTFPESNSRALSRAVALANGWTRVYTSRVGDESAGRRRAEIESDLWEQLDDIHESGATAGSVAASIHWRVIAGMPADLSWVHYQRAVARGSLKREKELTMNTFVRVVGQWWWVALGIAVGYALIAAGNLAEPGMPYLEGTILAFGCAALILAGTAVRVKWPVAGGLLIVGGVGPSILIWWAPVLVVLAVLAIAGAAL